MDEIRKKGDGEIVEKESLEGPAEAEASDERVRSELERLRRELEAKENYDRFLRQAAELENFKKRMAREKEEILRYGNENLIRDLLPILDNLERAVEHAREGGNGEPLLEGIEMVLKGLLEVLNRYGVTPILAAGETFDPQRHEAIAQAPSKEQAPNTVIEEHHRGYYLLDHLLRPSLVTVAKAPESQEKK